VVVEVTIGRTGYRSPLDRIVVDGYALADPFLARLPASRPWRPGHFWRGTPEGYVESLEHGDNRVRHPVLRRLYEDVRVVTSGPLFTTARARAMLRLHVSALPECLDPPCLELLLYADYPLEDYRPRLHAGGGRVAAIARNGAELVVSGVLALPADAPGQRLLAITRGTPIASAVASAATAQEEDPGAGFVLTLRFEDRREASQASRTLCLAVESRDTPPLLLESANPLCSQLVMSRPASPVPDLR
jgi:hypothetical protein